MAIARALLDRGANPNDFYLAGDSSYTALVGVAGAGEQDSPRQPQAEALFQLLLERGAEPFDIQVLYNTHFSGDVLWWLQLIYAHTMTTGLTTEWSDPNWSMLDSKRRQRSGIISGRSSARLRRRIADDSRRVRYDMRRRPTSASALSCLGKQFLWVAVVESRAHLVNDPRTWKGR